ncbi:MAG: TRAP transporter small permease [Pseudomonadota bacterium]|nr:TRAP transporter small permease [Pseudomonadota bacterium]
MKPVHAWGPVRSALDRACRIGEALSIAMLMAATVLIMIQIVAREVFNVGIPWADELARYAGLGLIFLLVPLLLARNGHVRVDLFLNMLPRTPKRVIEIGNELLTLVFCTLFLVSGYLFMLRAGRFSTPALGMPNLLFYAPAILGMALTFLVAIDRLVLALAGKPAGAPPPEDRTA